MTSSPGIGQGGHSRDWQQATASELIDHLRAHYHAGHRRQLPELVRLAREVETQQAGRPGCPVGLADHLQALQAELEAHMQKEEQVLFPMLRAGLRPSAPIAVMRSEHRQHAQALARMVALAGGLTAPPQADAPWRELAAGLRSLHESLMQHVHLEDEVLFAGRNRPGAPEIPDTGYDDGGGGGGGGGGGA